MAVKVNVDELIAGYNSGEGLVKLGKKHGINKMTVRKLLAKNGVTIRPKGRPKAEKNPCAEIDVGEVGGYRLPGDTGDSSSPY